MFSPNIPRVTAGRPDWPSLPGLRCLPKPPIVPLSPAERPHQDEATCWVAASQQTARVAEQPLSTPSTELLEGGRRKVT